MCEDLRENFSKHFQDLNDRETQINLFQRPFSVDVENVNEADAQLEHSNLHSNKPLLDTFQENSLLDFYSRLEQEKYSVLSNNARVWICQLASTYCCKQAFVVIKINKFDCEPG